MKVLILGGGGREHALAWKLAQSPLRKKLYIAPGNAGTSAIGENVSLDPEDNKAVADFAVKHKIDLVIPGPEAPIVNGIYDYFNENGLLKDHNCLAPDKTAALLEGSKIKAKRFMHRYKVPTAAYASFTKGEYEKAVTFVKNHNLPMVVKADGLAAGKGVIICQSVEEAEAAINSMLKEDTFGKAGNKIIIEEFLEGNEVSVFVLTNGKDYIQLPNARDYKRAGEGDTGPNTGGMGAISPSGADPEFLEKVRDRVVKPTIRGLEMEGFDFYGFLFFGLINVKGHPYVLEYNVRLGDPETEVILPRLNEDLLALCRDTCQNKITTRDAEVDQRIATTVIIASGGYPGKYEKGKTISGLDTVKDSIVFHAGTKQSNDKILTAGGRVLAVTSLGNNLNEALDASYKNVKQISFEGKFFRSDIGRNVTLEK